MINRNIFKHFIVIALTGIIGFLIATVSPAALNVITTLAGSWYLGTKIADWLQKKWPL